MVEDNGRKAQRLGLIADPDFPERMVESLADDLPGHLEREDSLSVDYEVDPVTAGRHSLREILEAARERRRERGWDYAICVTDLPVRRESCPVLAEADSDGGVAVVSLPALGGAQPYRRTKQIISQLLDEFTAPEGEEPQQGTGSQRYGLQNWLTELVAPIYRVADAENGAVDVRYLATKTSGRLRLLTGMVRTNRPWRLVFGLSSALAAALATSAFGLSSSTIWQISDQLSPGRQTTAALVSVAALVFWLIASHGLWERRGRGGTPDREQVVLYNISTLVTLLIGVGFMYLLLFAINFAVAAFLVPTSLLGSSLGHPVSMSHYVALAWGFTTMGVIAGALGSSFESDQAVRQAAYGYREEQRRWEIQRQRDRYREQNQRREQEEPDRNPEERDEREREERQREERAQQEEQEAQERERSGD